MIRFGLIFILSSTVCSATTLDHVKHFRVQVFPHFGAYAEPQGREAFADQVQITSAETCDRYAAVKDADGNWTPTGPLLSSAKQWSIQAAELKRKAKSLKFDEETPAAFYYECKAPFTVQRAAPLQSIEYSGNFVAMAIGKKVYIINLVDPDLYIKGVIPAEMPADWPLEAYKAQAVAARTFAWWTVAQARNENVNSDMDDTTSYQAYLGNSNRRPETDSASDDTHGIILTYKNEPIHAYFSSDSGGYTESAGAVFGADLPYCTAKPEQYLPSQTVRPTEWSATFSASSLQKLGVVPSGVQIASIKVGSRDKSGRAQTLVVTSTAKKQYTVAATTFRKLTRVRSTLFTLTQKGNSYTLSGKGYGHGVGMAQIGARAYVEHLNWTYDQVLLFYYSGASMIYQVAAE